MEEARDSPRGKKRDRPPTTAAEADAPARPRVSSVSSNEDIKSSYEEELEPGRPSAPKRRRQQGDGPDVDPHDDKSGSTRASGVGHVAVAISVTSPAAKASVAPTHASDATADAGQGPTPLVATRITTPDPRDNDDASVHSQPNDAAASGVGGDEAKAAGPAEPASPVPTYEYDDTGRLRRPAPSQTVDDATPLQADALSSDLVDKHKLLTDLILVEDPSQELKSMAKLTADSPILRARDQENFTLLGLAVSERNPVMVKWLLRCGAEPNTMLAGWSPLSMACRRQFEDDDSNSQAKADAIVRLLCQDMRTNINLPIGGSDGSAGGLFTPLMLASSCGAAAAVRVLMEYGADPNLWTGGEVGKGVTALIAAAGSPNIHCLRAIAAHPGPSLNAVSVTENATPLVAAVRAGLPESVQALLEVGADPHTELAHGETIFLNLCRMKDKDKRLSVGKVLAAWNRRCFMDALRAALEADIEFAVDLIRACDAKPAADEREGLVQDLLRVWNKPSHRTSGRAKLFVLEWVLGHCPPGSSCDVDTFALALTAEPAAVASQVLSRCPPTTTASKEAFLRAVIKAKRYDLMGSLVACGVDPNCVMDDGDRLLSVAVRNVDSKVGLALVEAGAEVNYVVQSTGLTPLHSLFVATFARMDSGGGLTIDDDWVKFAMALAKQSKAEDVDTEEGTYVMSAAQFGDESKIVKPLLELLCTRPGANLDAVDIVGRTALILSQSAWATQVLVDHGADVNIGTTAASDGYGEAGSTALAVAVFDKDWKRAMVCIKAGADLDKTYARNKTIWDLMKGTGSQAFRAEVRKYLGDAVRDMKDQLALARAEAETLRAAEAERTAEGKKFTAVPLMQVRADLQRLRTLRGRSANRAKELEDILGQCDVLTTDRAADRAGHGSMLSLETGMLRLIANEEELRRVQTAVWTACRGSGGGGDTGDAGDASGEGGAGRASHSASDLEAAIARRTALAKDQKRVATSVTSVLEVTVARQEGMLNMLRSVHEKLSQIQAEMKQGKQHGPSNDAAPAAGVDEDGDVAMDSDGTSPSSGVPASIVDDLVAEVDSLFTQLSSFTPALSPSLFGDDDDMDESMQDRVERWHQAQERLFESQHKLMQAVTNELASLSRVLLHAPPSFTTTLASALERGNEKIRLGQQAVSISQRVGQAVRVQALLADAILDDSPVTALQAQRASTTDRLYNSIDKLEAARTTVKRLRRRGQEVGPQLQQQEEASRQVEKSLVELRAVMAKLQRLAAVHPESAATSSARPDGALKVTSLDIQYAGVEELPGGDRLAFHATNIATGQHVWLLPAANAKAYEDAPARGGDAAAPAGFTELVAPAELRKLVLHPVLVCPSSLVEEGDRFDQMIEFPAAADTACIAAGAAPVSPQLALHYASQLLSALAFLHEQGMIHGAVSPSNVLFGEQSQAWLATANPVLCTSPGDGVEGGRQRCAAYLDLAALGTVLAALRIEPAQDDEPAAARAARDAMSTLVTKLTQLAKPGAPDGHTAHLFGMTPSVACNLLTQPSPDESSFVDRLQRVTRFVAQPGRGVMTVAVSREALLMSLVQPLLSGGKTPRMRLLRVELDGETGPDGLGLAAAVSRHVWAAVATNSPSLFGSVSLRTAVPAPGAGAGSEKGGGDGDAAPPAAVAADPATPTPASPSPTNATLAANVGCDLSEGQRVLGPTGVACAAASVCLRGVHPDGTALQPCLPIPYEKSQFDAAKLSFRVLGRWLAQCLLDGRRTGFALDPLLFRHLTAENSQWAGARLGLMDVPSCGTAVSVLVDAVRVCHLGGHTTDADGMLTFGRAGGDPTAVVTQDAKLTFVKQLLSSHIGARRKALSLIRKAWAKHLKTVSGVFEAVQQLSHWDLRAMMTGHDFVSGPAVASWLVFDPSFPAEDPRRGWLVRIVASMSVHSLRRLLLKLTRFPSLPFGSDSSCASPHARAWVCALDISTPGVCSPRGHDTPGVVLEAWQLWVNSAKSSDALREALMAAIWAE